MLLDTGRNSLSNLAGRANMFFNINESTVRSTFSIVAEYLIALAYQTR